MAYNILFVGNGDAGREIMLKAIMDKLLKESDSDGFSTTARGLVVLFPEPVNTKVADILKAHDTPMPYDCIYQLEQKDIDESDLVVTMNEDQKKSVLNTYNVSKDVLTFKELVEEEGVLLDPYGKDLMDYEYSYRELERMAEKVFTKCLGRLSINRMEEDKNDSTGQ